MKTLDLLLVTKRNRTVASAAGTRRQKHHATHHCCVRNYCYPLYTCTGWECRKVWAPKLVVKIKEKAKQKQGGGGLGDTMKMAWNVRISVNDEKRSCGVKTAGLSLLSEVATRSAQRKKGVLRNFAKFIGKHLRRSLFFNKVAGLRPATSL